MSNTTFYKNCTVYFAALRILGKSDDRFEDEYYYTMPVVSSTK